MQEPGSSPEYGVNLLKTPRDYALAFCDSLNDTEKRRWNRGWFAGEIANKEANSDSQEPMNLRELRAELQKELEAELRKIDGIDNAEERARDEATLVIDSVVLYLQIKLKKLKSSQNRNSEDAQGKGIFRIFPNQIRKLFGG